MEDSEFEEMYEKKEKELTRLIDDFLFQNDIVVRNQPDDRGGPVYYFMRGRITVSMDKVSDNF